MNALGIQLVWWGFGGFRTNDWGSLGPYPGSHSTRPGCIYAWRYSLLGVVEIRRWAKEPGAEGGG